jgi:hypothetical protein
MEENSDSRTNMKDDFWPNIVISSEHNKIHGRTEVVMQLKIQIVTQNENNSEYKSTWSQESTPLVHVNRS